MEKLSPKLFGKSTPSGLCRGKFLLEHSTRNKRAFAREGKGSAARVGERGVSAALLLACASGNWVDSLFDAAFAEIDEPDLRGARAASDRLRAPERRARRQPEGFARDRDAQTRQFEYLVSTKMYRLCPILSQILESFVVGVTIRG